MAVARQTHPDPQDVFAFANGRLPPDRAALVERHVANCQACCELLMDAPADSFERRLRSTGETLANQLESPTALPGAPEALSASGFAVTRDREQPSTSTESGIPAVLANHERYEVIRQLGKGGMGVVYEATHRMMERTVALKVINPNLLRTPDGLERFRREVRTAARLQHRNIVTAHDAENVDKLHFLVMEYVDGADLARVVAQHGRLPVKLSCHYIRQAALGLQHAHEQGMIHRDIKPQNLMVTREGQLKILDFGLARFAREQESGKPPTTAPTAKQQLQQMAQTITLPGSVLGTPDYIAPEQATDSRNADIRADIYSLGCTFYFLLAGRPPFDGETVLAKLVHHRNTVPDSLQKDRADLPAGVLAIVDRMLEKSPNNRFQTPGEIAAALGEVIESLKDPATSQFVKANSAPGFDARRAAGVANKTGPSRKTTQHDHADAATTANQESKHVSVLRDTPGEQEEIVDIDSLVVSPDELDLQDELSHTNLDAAAIPRSRRRSTRKRKPSRRRQIHIRRLITATLAGGLVVALTVMAISFLGDGSGAKGDGDSFAANPAVGSPGQKRVVIVVPFAGVWRPDVDPVIQTLEQKGIFVRVASTQTGKAKNIQSGIHDVKVHIPFSNVKADDWDAVVFVGYEVGEFIRDATTKQQVRNLVNQMEQQGRWVTSICAGTAVLAQSGILTSHNAAWSKFAGEQGADKQGKQTRSWDFRNPIVEHGHVITVSADSHACEFALRLASHLLDGK